MQRISKLIAILKLQEVIPGKNVTLDVFYNRAKYNI